MCATPHFFDQLRTCQYLSALCSVLLAFPFFLDGLLQTFDMLDDTTLNLSPAVGDPSDSLNLRARG